MDNEIIRAYVARFNNAGLALRHLQRRPEERYSLEKRIEGAASTLKKLVELAESLQRGGPMGTNNIDKLRVAFSTGVPLSDFQYALRVCERALNPSKLLHPDEVRNTREIFDAMVRSLPVV